MAGDGKCVCVCGARGTGCATGLWEGEQGHGEGVKMNEWVGDEGDWGQKAICSKEGPTGIWGQKCVCVCVYMNDSVVLGHLDCLPIHTLIHTRAYSFLTSPLLPVHAVYSNPAFHFLTSLRAFSHSTTSSFHSPRVHFRFDPGTIPPCGSRGTFPIRPWY